MNNTAPHYKHFMLLLLLVISPHLFSQTDAEFSKDKGFSLNVQSLMIFPYGNDVGGGSQDTAYDLELDSRILGFNTTLNYYLNPYLAAGLGIGYEKLNQPELVYYPLFINLRGSLLTTKNTPTTAVNFGVHLGDVDQSGFMFRWSLGYRTHILNDFLAYFEMHYSYQNLYKSFPDSGRIDNYYNVESIGVAISFEIQ